MHVTSYSFSGRGRNDTRVGRFGKQKTKIINDLSFPSFTRMTLKWNPQDCKEQGSLTFHLLQSKQVKRVENIKHISNKNRNKKFDSLFSYKPGHHPSFG